VPQLNPLNVTVIDQEGRLISQSQDPLRNAGLDPSQLKYVREIEANYAKRIEDILSPVVGTNNVRAQVTADIDFSQIEQVAESYKPNPAPETAIRSQQTIENSSGTPAAAGIPGALSNQPPVPATAPLSQPPVASASNSGNASVNYSKNISTNYEIDKTIRHTKSIPGTVRRLSVAIVVNHKKEIAKDPAKAKSLPLTDAEMKQLTELAREAVGFNKDRGDTVNVVNAPFTPVEKDTTPDAPFWENIVLISTLKDIGRYLLFAGLIFWLWTRLLKPMLGKLMETPNLPTSHSVSAEPGDQPNISQQTYETKLAMARDLAKKDPKVVASIVKGWVDGGERAK
jgi:flagellar M-ring protein FliF